MDVNLQKVISPRYHWLTMPVTLMYPTTMFGYLLMKQLAQMEPIECPQKIILPTFLSSSILTMSLPRSSAEPEQFPLRSSHPSKPGITKLIHLTLPFISVSRPAHSRWSPGDPCIVNTVNWLLISLSVIMANQPSPSYSRNRALGLYQTFFLEVISMPNISKFRWYISSAYLVCLYFQAWLLSSAMLQKYQFCSLLLVFVAEPVRDGALREGTDFSDCGRDIAGVAKKAAWVEASLSARKFLPDIDGLVEAGLVLQVFYDVIVNGSQVIRQKCLLEISIQNYETGMKNMNPDCGGCGLKWIWLISLIYKKKLQTFLNTGQSELLWVSQAPICFH